jgi:hypothetical protein
MNRFSALVAALLLAALGLGPAQGGDKKKGDDKEEKKGVKEGDGKSYDSPEKVFDAFVAAVRKGDGKSLCTCLTEEAARKMAGGLAASALIMKNYMERSAQKGKPKDVKDPAGDGDKEQPRKGEKGEKGKAGEDDENVPESARILGKALARHGFDKAALKEFDLPTLMAQTSQPQKAAALHRRLAKRLKDPCAFLGDMFRAFKKLAGASVPPELGFGKKVSLENLKTDEDSATAVVVLGGGAAKKSQPISFAKDQSGWRIDGPPIFGLPLPGVGAPPGPGVGPAPGVGSKQ